MFEDSDDDDDDSGDEKCRFSPLQTLVTSVHPCLVANGCLGLDS